MLCLLWLQWWGEKQKQQQNMPFQISDQDTSGMCIHLFVLFQWNFLSSLCWEDSWGPHILLQVLWSFLLALAFGTLCTCPATFNAFSGKLSMKFSLPMLNTDLQLSAKLLQGCFLCLKTHAIRHQMVKHMKELLTSCTLLSKAFQWHSFSVAGMPTFG